MRSTRWRALGLGVALLAAAHAARAAADPTPKDDENAALRERVESLEQTVSLLKRQAEAKDEAEASKGPQPILGAGPDGFYLQSADKKSFVLRLRGYVQTQGRFFANGDTVVPNDDILMRRVRPIFEGTVAEFVDFKIMTDFGQNATLLQDAYLNAHYWPLAQLQVGKFKEPFGLERLQSGSSLTFIERGLPNDIVPNRDVGAQLWGNWRQGLVTYQLAAFDGVTDGGSTDGDNNDGKDFVGRIFARPFQDTTWTPLAGFGIGFAGSFGKANGAPSTYKTAGQQTFFKYGSNVQQSGERVRISPQLYWSWGPFGLLGEWVLSSTTLRIKTATGRNPPDLQADNSAWQLQASYVLTGENASYYGVVPRDSFVPGKGTWGACELAARYGELHVDNDVFHSGFASLNDSARRARSYGVDFNWYLNRFLKWQLEFDQTFFDRGAKNGNDRPAEDVIMSQFQVSF